MYNNLYYISFLKEIKGGIEIIREGMDGNQMYVLG